MSRRWRNLAELERDCKFVGTSGEERVYKCPVCGPRDVKGHLYVNPKKGGYYCFRGCGTKGFIHSDNRQTTAFKKVDVTTLPPGSISLWNMEEWQYETFLQYHPILAQFFKERHLIFSDVFDMRLYYKPTGMYHHGLIFPVFWYGKMMGYLVRHLIKPRDGRKYTEVGSLKNYIYNYEFAIQAPTIIVCESILDVRAIGWYAVALFGSKISDAQRNLLRSYSGQIILFFDANKTAEAFAHCKKLSDLQIRMVVQPEIRGNVGPSCMTKAEIIQALSQAFFPTQAIIQQQLALPYKLNKIQQSLFSTVIRQ